MRRKKEEEEARYTERKNIKEEVYSRNVSHISVCLGLFYLFFLSLSFFFRRSCMHRARVSTVY